MLQGLLRYAVQEVMFAIGGNVSVPRYQKTKYEPLEVVYETQKEVGLSPSVRAFLLLLCVC